MVFESGWPTAKDFHRASAQLTGKGLWSITGDVVWPKQDDGGFQNYKTSESPLWHPWVELPGFSPAFH